jgi:hypothetical protein
VKRNGNTLEYADELLKSDPELKSIKATYFSLDYASESLKNDKEFILKAIKEKSGIILECAGDTTVVE